MIQKVIFLSILSFLFALFNLLFYKRVLPLFISSKKIKISIVALLFVFELLFVTLSLCSCLWSLRGVVSSVLGFMLLGVVFAAALEISRLFGVVYRLKWVVLSSFLMLFIVSLYNGQNKPSIKTTLVATSHKELKGKKIVMLSDVHIDPSKERFAKELKLQIDSIGADFVLIVGDVCDGRLEELKSALTPLLTLKSSYGTFFVPGNHEYYYGDFKEKMDFFRSFGVTVLQNSNKSVEGISFVGLTDPAATRAKEEGPQPKKAFAGSFAPSILLAHQPKTAYEALDYKPDFVFCGHTHRGQIWPFEYLVSLVQPFVYGEIVLDKSRVFVSSGAGVWGPPMRLFSESEILQIEFR